MSETFWISGLNAVAGILGTRYDLLVELKLEQDAGGERLALLWATAKKLGIAVQWMERRQMDQLATHARHQGVLARVRTPEMLREEALTGLIDNAGHEALFLLLDGVTDPHNLGACLRSAAAAGVTAVIAPKDRAVGLNETVLRASAGTALQLPMLQVTNLVRTMEQLKRANVWLYGAALEESAKSVYQTDLRGPVGLVLGAEGSGLRRLTRETCDALIHIPMAPDVESLNVSVSTGILLFEARRQRYHVTG